MLALREEFPVENDVSRLEPRIARIEGEVTQLNSRVGAVELDLREMRTSMDQKLDKLDGKIDRLDAKLERKLDAMSTRHFTLLVTLITATATLAAGVLAMVFGAAHLH